MGASGTDLGAAFGLCLINQLELGLRSKVVHSLDPTDNLSEAQGLFNTGAWYTLPRARQTLAKCILYLWHKISGWNQTPLHNRLLAVFDHVPEVATFNGFSSHRTLNHPSK